MHENFSRKKYAFQWLTNHISMKCHPSPYWRTATLLSTGEEELPISVGVNIMRMSTYCIAVQADEDEYLLINSLTGAVDVVDTDVINLLQTDLSQGDPSILNFLQERGHITDASSQEEFSHMEDFYRGVRPGICNRKRHIIIPTYKCNLRCTYCWESALYKNGASWMEKTLSFQEVDSLFEAVGELDKGVQQLEPLIYFGGEPMLPENVNLIAYMMKEGTERGYEHYFVTNGVTIPDYLDLLVSHPIKGIQITVDGMQSTHDSRRKGPRGEGSFHRIVEGVELLRDHSIKTYIRVNVDKLNINSIGELASFFKEYGWHDDAYLTMYLAPVFPHGCGGYSKAFTREASISGLISLWNNHDVWDVFKKGISDFHPVESALRGEAWSPQFFNCGAHCDQLFFDAHGSIYTCWEAVGETQHCVGRFIPHLQFNENYKKWMERTVFTIEKCRSCELAFLCGGGCAYDAYEQHHTISEPTCGHAEKVLREYIPFYYNYVLRGNSHSK
ncbi:MAG: radical SAM protein [Theionarchaea archaeon]|nr:radical SAM protein [Theionarchaea archaeon]